MHEIDLLREWDPDGAPLTDEARARARNRLLAVARDARRADGPSLPPRRRSVPRAALVGVLTAAVAATVLVAADLGRAPHGPLTSPPLSPSSALPFPDGSGPDGFDPNESGPAEILRGAASHEREHAETIAPRDDQFVYVRQTVEERDRETGEVRVHTDESWMSVDGSRPSRTEDPEGDSWSRAPEGDDPVWPPRTWRELEELPTDPAGLLRLLGDEVLVRPDTGRLAPADGAPDVGDRLVELLRGVPVMPEGLRAAAYEALARVPGITARTSQEHVGGVAVSYENPWARGAGARTVFVFDAETHALVEVRDERTEDGRSTWIHSRLEEYAVVDRVRQRP
ncbi:CU044_5270 family protein [Streptomyces megasporus]|uniref:CU044_5270 family protein n=1 Tax=Streptomyces megasporus TaxID=44060 RepID=UPI0006907457|nr:CU044_5270 family protein [Streptomyces megasporus]